jgi:hypothetical protein
MLCFPSRVLLLGLLPGLDEARHSHLEQRLNQEPDLNLELDSNLKPDLNLHLKDSHHSAKQLLIAGLTKFF